MRDQTEEQMAKKAELNTELHPVKPLPKGYDFNKMFNGQHDLTKQDLIYLKMNNQNQKIDLRHRPFANKDKIVTHNGSTLSEPSS